MSFQQLTTAEIPLVETAPGSPAYDLFATVRDPESDELYRSIWEDFCTELSPRIESLGAIRDFAEMKQELHAIRGMSSQFGLFLLEMFLFSWEMKGLDPVAESPRFLPGARVIAARSLEAIEQAFAHLKR